MQNSSSFRLLCTLVLCFYTTITSVQAGQVITSEDRTWAKQSLEREAQLGDLQDTKSIAVLNYHNLTVQDQLNPLQKGLALMLITDLSKVESLVVVERIRMQALVDELELGASGLMDTDTAPRIGRLLRAYHIVGGEFRSGSPQPLEIASTLINVPFETLTDLPPSTGSLDELYRLEKKVLFSIIEKLEVEVTPEKKKELADPLSLSSAALLALFMGIDFSDKGMYSEAAEMYNKALAEDPNLKIAQDSLQELKDMGLESSEDVSKPKAQEEVSASGGSGAGTVVAVGLGLAAVAGGVALAAGSSSSSDGSTDQGSNQPEMVADPEEGIGDDTGADAADTTDTTPPSVSVDGGKTSIDCAGDSVSFIFSEPVFPSTGSYALTPAGFSSQEWLWSNKNTVLTMIISPPCESCNSICVTDPIEGTGSIPTYTVALSGYQDASGNALLVRKFEFSTF